jgi:hypothetical protein
MPYNGSGSFSAPGASFPAVSGALIESAKYNAVVNDIATGLSTAIAKDGQTTVTANLPMAGYRHTGVGNAVSRTDYAAAGQVQDSAFTWAGTAGGTADAITLTLTPAISAYAAGQSFTYKSSASANTGAMTVNINGVGAKAIQKNAAALAAGDHAASSWFRITYDGAAFQLERLGDIALQAPLASPTFTGAPAAPTAAVDTNTTQLATTAFVLAQAGAATPLVDAATAVVGTSTRFARADHVHPQRNIASGTATASTSGTAIDFTSIPSWVKKITVIFSGVSTSGISPVLVQIGDSGGIEATVYASTYCSIDSSTTVYTEGSTVGFIVPGLLAASIRSGSLVMTLLDSSTNTWVASGVFKTSPTVSAYTGGDKSLSATLDRVRITTTNGTDTFDAGKINILYE